MAVEGVDTGSEGMGVGGAAFAFEGNETDDVVGEPTPKAVTMKIVFGADGTEEMDHAEGEEGEQDHGIQVTVMVGDQDGGALAGEMVESAHVDAQDQQYKRPDHAEEQKDAEEGVHDQV